MADEQRQGQRDRAHEEALERARYGETRQRTGQDQARPGTTEREQEGEHPLESEAQLPDEARQRQQQPD